MHTNEGQHQDGRRRRRRHSAEFKAEVIAACKQPGVSIASVALSHGLNANLLRHWIAKHERAAAAPPQVSTLSNTAPTDATSGFVPVTVAAPFHPNARGAAIVADLVWKELEPILRRPT